MRDSRFSFIFDDQQAVDLCAFVIDGVERASSALTSSNTFNAS
jgi:hypothetical protein